jgi:hypothetical protein
MTFLTFNVVPQTKVIDEYIRDIETAPIRFNALVNKLVSGRGGYIRRIEKEVTPYPGKPKRPIRWKSERQRKAYFASNGFGGGIPSRRTGKLQKSWRIIFRPLQRGGDGSIQIYNDDPKASFVVGIHQQPMHLDTGWIRVDKSPGLQKIERDLTRDIIEAWGSILMKPKGNFR